MEALRTNTYAEIPEWALLLSRSLNPAVHPFSLSRLTIARWARPPPFPPTSWLPQRSSPGPIRPPFIQRVDLWHRWRELEWVTLFSRWKEPVGWSKTGEGERERIKEKERCYPIYPRSGSSPLFFALQRRKARREGEESVRYLKRRFVKRPSTIPPCATRAWQRGSDRENNNVQTKLERRQEIAIACDRKLARASEHRRCLSTLINPNRQNSALTPK